MAHGSRTTTPDRAKEGLPPFCGTVEDVVMIDREQAQLFSSLRQTRSPFHGVADWPSLGDALARRSRELLAARGKAHWAVAGGIRGPDGKPTCLLTSPLATEVVRALATDPGGLLWTDAEGTVWAVRLVPGGGQHPMSFFGFAIGWKGNQALSTKLRRKTQSVQIPLTAALPHLEHQARRLWLGGRAEQLLWAVHLAVVRQRRSVVLLPDYLLGQIIWGGADCEWPKDWRADLFFTLRSLTDLRSEVLRLGSEGWRPQLGAYSVAVATVEQLWVTRPDQDVCRPSCPMWGQDARHCHFLVQVGCGFLGVMEKFARSEEEMGCRNYDFGHWPKEDAGKELTEAKKSGQLITVSAPTALFGPLNGQDYRQRRVGSFRPYSAK